LAKSGRTDEARSILEALSKSSDEKYVAPYTIALAYNGLGRQVEALTWLERAYAQHGVAMGFLKVEPKWNNLPATQDFKICCAVLVSRLTTATDGPDSTRIAR
jgi:hypothetical protein